MRRFVLLSLLLMLAGCTTLEVRQAEPEAARVEGTAQALQTQARDAYQRGAWQESAQYYLALVEKTPREVEPWFRLGNIYARLQQPEKAVAAYREALLRQPDLAKAWYNMGVTQLQQAMHSFTQLQTNVSPADPLYLRGQETFLRLQELLGGDADE